MEKHYWMKETLRDMAAYAKLNNLREISNTLAWVEDNIAEQLERPLPPMQIVRDPNTSNVYRMVRSQNPAQVHLLPSA